jgi:hypothetical protein
MGCGVGCEHDLQSGDCLGSAMRAHLTMILPKRTEWWARLVTERGVLGESLTLWRPVDRHPGYESVAALLRSAGTPQSQLEPKARSLLT